MTAAKRTILIRLLVTISLVCSSLPAFAGDSVLEINQVCITSGGCFAGDSDGYPIEINESGSYILTSNVEVNQNTSAIVINVDDVSLNLNGFSIRGPAVCSGTPVTGCTSTGIGDGITINGDHVGIHNGTISGMGRFGIVIDETGGHRISDLTIGECGNDGIRASSTPSNIAASIVHDTSVFRNGDDGIDVLGEIYVYSSLLIGNGRAGQSGGLCRGVVFDGNAQSSSCTAVDPNH